MNTKQKLTTPEEIGVRLYLGGTQDIEQIQFRRSGAATSVTMNPGKWFKKVTTFEDFTPNTYLIMEYGNQFYLLWHEADAVKMVDLLDTDYTITKTLVDTLLEPQ